MGELEAIEGKRRRTMITKTETIEGKEYTFASSALLPKLYRVKFGRDMIADVTKLKKVYQTADGDEEKIIESLDYGTFERIAWMMAKHADKDTPELDDWLMGFDSAFAIYTAMPTIMELWTREQKTTSIPRKK